EVVEALHVLDHLIGMDEVEGRVIERPRRVEVSRANVEAPLTRTGCELRHDLEPRHLASRDPEPRAKLLRPGSVLAADVEQARGRVDGQRREDLATVSRRGIRPKPLHEARERGHEARVCAPAQPIVSDKVLLETAPSASRVRSAIRNTPVLAGTAKQPAMTASNVIARAKRTRISKPPASARHGRRRRTLAGRLQARARICRRGNSGPAVTEPTPWGARRRLLDVANTLRLARPAVRVYELGLAAKSGLTAAARKREDGSPPPPASLRAQAGPRHADAGFFLRSGQKHAELIREILRENGASVDDCEALLDWGCGCGRVLRH